jgi:hypothetical protein
LQAATSVFEDDVFNDGGGFGEQQTPILDHGGSTQWM